MANKYLEELQDPVSSRKDTVKVYNAMIARKLEADIDMFGGISTSTGRKRATSLLQEIFNYSADNDDLNAEAAYKDLKQGIQGSGLGAQIDLYLQDNGLGYIIKKANKNSKEPALR